MNKTLLKFYIFFIVAFFVFINIFPSIFVNINNTVNYIVDKTIIAFKEKKDNNVNIYENKANVIIMLDDGWKTQYTIGYKYMHEKKMRGSIAVIPSLVGEPEYMNKGDLNVLYDDNWDLLNHTYSHVVLTKSNVDKQTMEINGADKWFHKNGLINSNKILIYPEGEYNSDTIMVMKELNYISGRGTEEGFNAKIPINLYDIKVKNVLTGIDPDEVNDWIDYAIKNNLTVILLFHKLENDVDKLLMKYNVKDFYKIINHIDKRRSKLNIITYSDWIQGIIYNVNKT